MNEKFSVNFAFASAPNFQIVRFYRVEVYESATASIATFCVEMRLQFRFTFSVSVWNIILSLRVTCIFQARLERERVSDWKIEEGKERQEVRRAKEWVEEEEKKPISYALGYGFFCQIVKMARQIMLPFAWNDFISVHFCAMNVQRFNRAFAKPPEKSYFNIRNFALTVANQ